jgi:hypothetical protein
MKPLSGMNDRLQPGMSMAAASRAAWRDADGMDVREGKSCRQRAMRLRRNN